MRAGPPDGRSRRAAILIALGSGISFAAVMSALFFRPSNNGGSTAFGIVCAVLLFVVFVVSLVYVYRMGSESSAQPPKSHE